MSDDKTEIALEMGEDASARGGKSRAEAAADAGTSVFELPEEVIRIRLEEFEGPFEVLLYLIKQQEIDIFDIPVLQITEQYLTFLDMMHEENLDIAGEFIVMAATLIQIKSRMLIPVELEEDEEEIEEEDPRLELVEKLLEYRKFRDLTEALGNCEKACANWFPRFVKPKFEIIENEDEYYDVSLYDLIKAIRAMLRFVFGEMVHEVMAEGSSVDEKISLIEDLLQENESVTWQDLMAQSKTKVELVCCLLAILELCRMRRIRAHQHSVYGDIRIFARAPEADDLEEGETADAENVLETA